jgi:ribonuclease P protein component
MKYKLGKEEKLKSKKLIERLFAEGNRIKSFPLQLIYLPINHNEVFPNKVGFSVPKRNIKSAVSRNRIKRLMREVYRKNKYLFTEKVNQQYIFMFIYTSYEEIKYVDLEISLKKVCIQYLNKIQINEKN